MIKQLKAWYNNRLEQARKQAYNSGYDWVAGKLLRGEVDAEDEIEGYTYGRTEPFDHGAREAVVDFHNQLRTRRGSDGIAHYNSIHAGTPPRT